MSNTSDTKLLEIYDRLMSEYGPQRWWLGDTSFEVIIGAILTQSTSWTNVEKAINNLKSAGALSPKGLRSLPLQRLAKIIRPSGYYNNKAKKLKAFANFLGEQYEDKLDVLFANDVETLRKLLLAVHGIGPETADSIILYAAEKPVFVIDAYTKRSFSRLGLLPATACYDECQEYFMSRLPADTKIFNEYHALLVSHGKTACRKTPVCSHCCLQAICTYDSRYISQK